VVEFTNQRVLKLTPLRSPVRGQSCYEA
jgi:hypothetical protein